jgi:hypothetical protein
MATAKRTGCPAFRLIEGQEGRQSVKRAAGVRGVLVLARRCVNNDLKKGGLIYPQAPPQRGASLTA